MRRSDDDSVGASTGNVVGHPFPGDAETNTCTFGKADEHARYDVNVEPNADRFKNLGPR